MRIDGLAPIVRPESAAPADRGPAPPNELRQLLSPAELDYFAELEKLGPLTYGRRGAGTDQFVPPPVLGRRIDVRA